MEKVKLMLNQNGEETEKVLLNLHDRIVWLSDYGPEYGIVKWIGHLPEADTKELIAGIEFVSCTATGFLLPYFCTLVFFQNCFQKGGDELAERNRHTDAFLQAAKKISMHFILHFTYQ